jgi:RNA methyltransferase, TrmH family
VQTTIISGSNQKIKYVRSLSRRNVRHKERRFVIEGVTLLDEALRAGITPALILYTPLFEQRPEARALLAQCEERGVGVDVVESRLLDALSDTVTPQGLLAVVPFPELPAPVRPLLTLIVDQIAIPGNLGTLLRSAEAAGVDRVLVGPGATDPFGPKTVRGGMGVHFRLPIRIFSEWETLRREVADTPAYLAEAGAGRAYYDVDWRRPSALIIGSEAHGPSGEARQMMSESIHIPMSGQTESLNAGVAGSIILFEAARQRRAGG